MQRGRYGAAKRDRLIHFALPVTQENAAGEPVEDSLADAGNAWAAVSYGKAQERREAGIEGNDLPATFITLQNAATRAIGPGHVVLFDGYRWDITSAAPFERTEMEFTAVRRASLTQGA
ncbi:MAG: hypothetical protein Q27BB25_04625 [Blastomonas sp. CACIA14H2]|uniref:phage head completion protein n=1 Tax=Blastomonas sp. CACIA14H2 TaxID=1419876 RepID=UPI0003CFB6DF|nr:MAG: hypothetical protein Q27BB25_04625 [Blastomonas sp. CACIA14H2]